MSHYCNYNAIVNRMTKLSYKQITIESVREVLLTERQTIKEL